VLDGNTSAAAFYEKHGFVFDNTTQEVVYTTPVTCKRYVLKKSDSKDELHLLLNQGLDDMNKGKGRSAEEVFADIEKRFGFGER